MRLCFWIEETQFNVLAKENCAHVKLGALDNVL